MAFYLSPVVAVKETDLTTAVQATSTNITAYVGRFKQGPVNTTQLVTSDRDLVELFGLPDNDTYDDFFNCINFFTEGNKLYVTRVVNEDGIQTSLTGSHGSSLTTLTVASTTNFPIAGKLRIDDSEVVKYSGKTTTSFLNVTRGIAGTSAATHSSGVTVVQEVENASIAISSDSVPFVNGVAAHGSFHARPISEIENGDSVVISDGENSVTLEYITDTRENAAFTADDTTDVITTTLSLSNLEAVTVSNSGGGLPTGLSASTVYYYNSTTGKLYASRANAKADTSAINITSTGTGTHTITRAKYGSGQKTLSGSIPIDVTADWNATSIEHPNTVFNYVIDDMYKVTVVDSGNMQTCPFSSSSGYLGTFTTTANADTHFDGSVICTTSEAARGIIRYINGNVLYVQMTTSVFAEGDLIDNANTFSAADTTVTAVEKMLNMFSYHATSGSVTVDDSADTITFASNTDNFVTGSKFRFTAGVLPTGISASTDYYLHFNPSSTTVASVYLTLEAALSGTNIGKYNFTDTGTTVVANLKSVTLWNSDSGEYSENGNIDIVDNGSAVYIFETFGMFEAVAPEYHRDAYVTRLNGNVEPLATPTYADQEVLKVYAKSPGSFGQNYSVSIANPVDFDSRYALGDSSSGLTWKSAVETKPSDDRREIALVVIEQDKLGNKSIVEKYTCSLLETARTLDGETNFIENVVNNKSTRIFVDVNPVVSGETPIQTTTTDDPTSSSITTINVASTDGYPSAGRIKIADEFITYTGVTSTSFTGCTRGADGTTPTVHAVDSAVYEYNSSASVTDIVLTGGADAIYSRESIRDEIMLGYDLYVNPEEITVDLLIDGANCNDVTIQQYIVDYICDVRRDCMAILSVPWSSVNYPTESQRVTAMIDYRGNTLARSSSYAALYGNWKRQYDKYNDVFRWVSMSGDIAAAYAFTDASTDPWFAPAGFSRGRVKGVSTFKVRPTLGMRDEMYKNGINPVLSFKNDGPVIFGQKTLLTRPSAFDRVNVRRLFLVLERAISTAARYFLFEPNDRFTRKAVLSMIEPFLREVQGRRGIESFFVKCDEENNPPSVRQRQELHADIYIKPVYAVEAIVLNFIATPLGANFQEIVKSLSVV